MIQGAIKWFAICLFIGLAYSDNLQPAAAGPVLEAGSRIVKAGEVLFAGGCTHVFRCEEIIKDVEQTTPKLKKTAKEIVSWNLVMTPQFDEWVGEDSDSTEYLLGSRIEKRLSEKYNPLYLNHEDPDLHISTSLHNIDNVTIFTMRKLRASDGATLDVKTSSCEMCTLSEIADLVENTL